MKVTVFLFIFSILQFGASAQKKGNLPPAPLKMPERDGVVAIDNIAAGKGKVFNYFGQSVKLSISGEPANGQPTKINAVYNHKPLLAKRSITATEQAISLKLLKGDNVLVISPDKQNTDAPAKVYISFSNKGVSHSITAELAKGKSDTIIIKRH